jgi:hypothetical protein
MIGDRRARLENRGISTDLAGRAIDIPQLEPNPTCFPQGVIGCSVSQLWKQ